MSFTPKTLIRLCGTVKLHNLFTWTRVIYCSVLCQWNGYDCPQNQTLTDHLYVVQCTYCNTVIILISAQEEGLYLTDKETCLMRSHN